MEMSKWNKKLTKEEYKERKRLTARARTKLLKKKCETCGTEKRLEIHHIDRNWRNNEPENIMTLCSICHMKWHHERGHIFPEERRAKPCAAPGCDRKSRYVGYCEMHRDRILAHGSTEKRAPKPRLPCKVCGKEFVPLLSRGDLCNIHRKVKERYGDPFAKQVGRGGIIPGHS